MKTEQEYIKDLSEIRSMMERSTKFVSLSGLSGIMAGIYALAGAYIAYRQFYQNTDTPLFNTLYPQDMAGIVVSLVMLAIAVLVLAVGTAVYLSHRKAARDKQVLWNPTSRRLLFNMSIPLLTGGLFILVLISNGILGLIAPLSLIFYGLALLNASKFTYDEIKYLGMTEIILGLLSSCFIGYGLFFWAVGFGLMHIGYGIYMHQKYER